MAAQLQTLSLTGIQVSSAGNANVTIAASVTNSAGRSVQVLNRNGGTTTLSGNISDTGTGINVANNTAGHDHFSAVVSKTVNTGANQSVTPQHQCRRNDQL